MFEIQTKIDETLYLTQASALFLIDDLFDKYFETREPNVDKIRWEYSLLTTELNILRDYIIRIGDELTEISASLDKKKKEA